MHLSWDNKKFAPPSFTSKKRIEVRAFSVVLYNNEKLSTCFEDKVSFSSVLDI